MFRTISSLVLILLVCSFAHAQREIEKGEIRKIEKSPSGTRREAPRGAKVAAKKTNGVLFVLTEPPTAHVIIKNSQGVVLKREPSDNGELRAELPQGKYSVEVTADQYIPRSEPNVLISSAEPRTVRVYLKPTTGSIVIGMGQVGLDGTTVLIDEQPPARLKVKMNLMREENQIELAGVPEGMHTLSVANPGIAVWKRDKVQVSGGDILTLAPRFQMALLTLIVKSEPDTEIYLDGIKEGKTSATGELRIPDRKPGQHTIRAEKDRFEPASKTETFGIGSTVVDLRLSSIKASPEFSDYFQAGTSFWDAPKSWQVRTSKLFVRDAPEVGLRNGFYDDFKMVFDISFVNNKGAVWVIRARDKKNFYLFQLVGPGGANPKLFQSFVYQNGQAKLLSSDRVVEDLSRPNDSFTITVEAKGPTIKHSIQLKSNPAAGTQPISTLTDNTYSYGAVGFGTLNAEEFVVYVVSVFPEVKTR